MGQLGKRKSTYTPNTELMIRIDGLRKVVSVRLGSRGRLLFAGLKPSRQPIRPVR